MPPSDQSSLGRGFSRFFTVEPATSPGLLDQVFRIRHEVYCEDLGFEPVRDNGLEHDRYDTHSRHCLLWTNTQPRQPVGCTRLVLTDPVDRTAPLPFETTCASSLDRSIVDPARLPRESIGEVSRLAVRSLFRRRRGEQGQADPVDENDFGSAAQPRFPYIPIGLYLGAVALALRSGVDTLFVLTEPRLAAHFAKLGVDVRRIGAPIEHRGFRVPSMIDVPHVVATMRPLVRPIWEIIEDEIERGLQQASSNLHLQAGEKR